MTNTSHQLSRREDRHGKVSHAQKSPTNTERKLVLAKPALFRIVLFAVPSGQSV